MFLCNKCMIELQRKQLLMVQHKKVLERIQKWLMLIMQVENAPRNGVATVDDVAHARNCLMSCELAKTFITNLANLSVLSLNKVLEQDDPEKVHQMNEDIDNMFMQLSMAYSF